MHRTNRGDHEPLVLAKRVDGRVYSRAVVHGLVCASEAAELLGVTIRTVWNLVRRGRLHPVHRGTRTFFLSSEIRARRAGR